ncbi:NYN domain-containing protein [Rugamonas sp. CCM 8940]|uniref:NYN domain-containing protein n=1 Tax=Rugamonas sp. CCM 8940 TaxID=2765359 RepID=UPI001A34E233|nr:NYN domain-containing protein [Rugamonas sp. CCM 8940]
MPTSRAAVRRTAVYIDGYNLYYGRLRGTKFKWFDVVQFFESLLVQRDQNEVLEKVIFFTAPALATFATHGVASVEAQSAYHRALKTLYGDRVEMVYGNHSYDKNGSLIAAFVEGQPHDRSNRVRVWKLEEKKTDVNLAIRMYRDANKRLYDRVILVSNDSDAEPVLEAIREDFGSIMIGVVAPIRPPVHGATIHRRLSGSLARLAHWTMNNLSDDQLLQAQLPSLVPTKKKPIRKPAHW